MHRFINSLASTEYKNDLTAVEVDFNGFGSTQVYYQTMEIAASLVMMRKANLWLLIKEDFHDMEAWQFLNFLKNWFQNPKFKLCEQKCESECRMAIVTSPRYLNELKQAYRSSEFGQKIPPHVSLGFFASKNAANAFLKQSYAELQAYEHGSTLNTY